MPRAEAGTKRGERIIVRCTRTQIGQIPRHVRPAAFEIGIVISAIDTQSLSLIYQAPYEKWFDGEGRSQAWRWSQASAAVS